MLRFLTQTTDSKRRETQNDIMKTARIHREKKDKDYTY